MKTLKSAGVKPFERAALSSVLWFVDLGELTVPDQLNLGSDGKLYLTHSNGSAGACHIPQSISLKESVGWFRVANECGLRFVEGERFRDWLHLIEQTLSNRKVPYNKQCYG